MIGLRWVIDWLVRLRMRRRVRGCTEETRREAWQLWIDLGGEG